MQHIVIEFSDDAPTENLFNSAGHEYILIPNEMHVAVYEKRRIDASIVKNTRLIPWSRIHAITIVGE